MTLALGKKASWIEYLNVFKVIRKDVNNTNVKVTLRNKIAKENNKTVTIWEHVNDIWYKAFQFKLYLYNFPFFLVCNAYGWWNKQLLNVLAN